MAHNRGCPKGLVFTAFGAGILLALCFPVKIMLFILAVMLVILGVTSCQRQTYLKEASYESCSIQKSQSIKRYIENVI